MGQLALTRVDYRMIHGQTVFKWMTLCTIDRIVLVCDSLLKDPFMAGVYKNAANGKAVDIIGLKDLQATVDAKNDKIMLIFVSVEDAYTAFKNGFNMSELNIGAVQMDKEKTRRDVVQGVAISPKEYDQLLEMKSAGMKIFFQAIPERGATSLDSVKNKFK